MAIRTRPLVFATILVRIDDHRLPEGVIPEQLGYKAKARRGGC